jgi:cholesterol oxidase
MIRAGGRAVKRTPVAPRHADLPADYLDRATAIRTPMLLVAGQENALMQDANVRFFEVLRRVPAVPHELLVVPGYGHCDIFMGKDVHRDIFPRLVAFLRRHGEPPLPGGGGPPAAALPPVTA